MRDWFWIQRILDGGPLIVPGTGDFAFQHVYVVDVARAFKQTLEASRCIGEAYNVASEEIFTLNGYLQELGRLLGRGPQLVHLPQEEFDALPFSTNPQGDVFPFNTRRDSTFSLDKVKRDLGYPSTPLREWMPATIEWHTRGSDRHSIGYEYRDEELRFVAQFCETAGPV
jgi:nucleoside-diphosphate-sugar epimerase